ncbi:MAG: LacI family DNA-binding transcriptional regulator [Bacillaceae bacterium]|nr:LacI family DNA-binding transcriptional regulator [Bacillaceae bacterium]
MKPTIRDVARMANVSISTVSRVMNAPETVVEDKRERVLEAIKKLQYQPNAFARGLIYKKSNTLGVMIPDVENPYYAGVLRGMQDSAVKLGYSLMIFNTDRNKQRTVDYMRHLYEKQADGVIFASDVFHQEYYEAARHYQIPIVLVSTNSQEFEVPSVDIDDEKAAYDAVKYLIESGHRNIGMISFPFDDSISGLPRYQGFKKALKDFELEDCLSQVSFANHRFEEAYDATQQLFSRFPDLTAIFASSDEFAMGAITYLHEHGIAVPEQVAVIGFDDIRMAHMFIPKLTTIAQPVYEIGQRSVEKLHELITQGKVKNLRERLPHKLVIRDST